MASKRVYVQMATLFWVGIAIIFVMESHLTEQELFSCLRKQFTLIKKIVHFLLSMLMLHSEHMVLLHFKHKILCS